MPTHSRSAGSRDDLPALRARAAALRDECARLEIEADRYRDLYENGPDMCGSIDAVTGNIIEGNARFFEETGWEPHELIGRHLFDVFAPESHDETRGGISTYVEHGEIRDLALMILCKNGRRIPASVSAVLVRDADGQPVCSRAVMRDASTSHSIMRRLRASEQRFRQLAENVPLIPWAAELSLSPEQIATPADRDRVMSPNSTWLSNVRLNYVGPQVRRILGYEPAQFMLPGFWISKTYPEDRNWPVTYSRDAVKHGSRHISHYRIHAADGRTVWIDDHVSVVHEEGQVFITGVMLDVTKRVRARERRRRLMWELDHRVKDSLSTTSAIARHSRRSDLTVEEFRDRLVSRMRNMADVQHAHSLVDWQRLAMDRLVDAALAPIRSHPRVRHGGAPVELGAQLVQPLGLALHELALNAMAHGALSGPEGEVALSWTCEDTDSGTILCVEWIETGTRRRRSSDGKGLGTFVLSRLVPYELDADVDLNMDDDSVRCTLQIPLPQQTAEPPVSSDA